jgi:phosphosulfolactate phosphohydrolase-like enzyme
MMWKSSRARILLSAVILAAVVLDPWSTFADEAYTQTAAVGIPGGFASADIVFADAVAGVVDGRSHEPSGRHRRPESDRD